MYCTKWILDIGFMEGQNTYWTLASDILGDFNNGVMLEMLDINSTPRISALLRSRADGSSSLRPAE